MPCRKGRSKGMRPGMSSGSKESSDASNDLSDSSSGRPSGSKLQKRGAGHDSMEKSKFHSQKGSQLWVRSANNFYGAFYGHFLLVIIYEMPLRVPMPNFSPGIFRACFMCVVHTWTTLPSRVCPGSDVRVVTTKHLQRRGGKQTVHHGRLLDTSSPTSHLHCPMPRDPSPTAPLLFTLRPSSGALGGQRISARRPRQCHRSPRRSSRRHHAWSKSQIQN